MVVQAARDALQPPQLLQRLPQLLLRHLCQHGDERALLPQRQPVARGEEAVSPRHQLQHRGRAVVARGDPPDDRVAAAGWGEGGGGGCVCGGAALQASGAQPCPPAPPPELVLRGQLFQNLLRRKPPPIQIDARHSRAAKMSIRKTQRQLVQVRRHKGCERLHARGPALQQAQRGSSLEGGAVQPPARPHATCPHAHRAPARKSRPGLSMCPPALCSEEGEAGGQRREAAWGHPDQLT